MPAGILLAFVLLPGLLKLWMPVSVSAQGQDSTLQLPDVPDTGVFKPELPEKRDYYQTGVREYLNKNDEKAISCLKEAVQLNRGDERANLLLLKVFMRAIRGYYERGDYKKVHSLVKQAKEYFPSNPEMAVLYASVQEVFPLPVRKKPGERGAYVLSAVKPRAERRHVVLDISTVAAPQIVIKPVSAPVAAKNISVFYAIAPAALMGGLFFAIFMQFKKQKTVLKLQSRSLREALDKSEAEKAEILRKLEVQEGVLQCSEELHGFRKAQEQKICLELEEKKRGEEEKLMTELAEKRRIEEERLLLEFGLKKLSAQKPEVPKEKKLSVKLAEARKSAEHTLAVRQEKRILGILVNVEPPERLAAWERIAYQAAGLYEISPTETLKFLKKLAGDENPWNRASIAQALAQIGTPAALDILLELAGDRDVEVQREALKHLKRLRSTGTVAVPDGYLQKIDDFLNSRKAGCDWVF